MKTINELGIYFMCCFIFATLFITYLAVKLRAYRIKNAKLINRIEIADKDIADAYEALENINVQITELRTKSAAIINQSAENNAKLVKELEANNLLVISYKELAASYKETCESIQEELDKSMEQNSEITNELVEIKSDRQKLFDIAKGATAKLAEMNVALEGLDNPLRSVTSLKENECIEVCSEIERDALLELFDINGIKWRDGMKASFYKYEVPLLFVLEGSDLTYAPKNLFHCHDGDTLLKPSEFINL